MKESKPGLIERSANKVKKAAEVVGGLALLGTVIAPALAVYAFTSGLVWLALTKLNT